MAGTSCVLQSPTTAAEAQGIVGVLGGMGPLATLDFMHKMIRATPARCDQEHVPTIVTSIPQIPDRTRAYRGEGPSPLAELLNCAVLLERAGAGAIVIPCNTAHLWFEEIQTSVRIPILHMVDAAVEDAAKRSGLNPRLGLLATQATVDSDLYARRAAAQEASADWVLPTELEMGELVMPGIAAVKSGELDSGAHLLQRAAESLHARGATALILGCTEIPLVVHESSLPLPVVDATEALARRAVRWSLVHAENSGTS